MTAIHADHQMLRHTARLRPSSVRRHRAPIWPMPAVSQLPTEIAFVLVSARVVGVLLQLAAMVSLLVAPGSAVAFAVGSVCCLLIVAAVRAAASGPVGR